MRARIAAELPSLEIAARLARLAYTLRQSPESFEEKETAVAELRGARYALRHGLTSCAELVQSERRRPRRRADPLAMRRTAL